MATGYTHALTERDVTFEEFALSCSRAFGALVMMRDEPMDAPVSDKTFEPAPYYVKQLADAKRKLATWRGLSHSERKDAMDQRKAEEIMSAQDYLKSNERDSAAFATMTEKVKAWTPPSDEHEGLKAFMLKQLESSMMPPDYGRQLLAEANALNVERMAEDEEQELIKAVGDAAKSLAEETERQAGRKAWFYKLRASLAEVQ